MYHITLAYIGESDEDMRFRATEAVKSCARSFSSPALLPGKPGYFGKREKAILYLGVIDAGALMALTSKLRELLADKGLPFDPKPLNPHITLARHINVTDELLKIHGDIRAFSPEGITLFNSCRIDGALRYVPLHFERFNKQR